MNEEQDKLSLADKNVENNAEAAQQPSAEKPVGGAAQKAQPKTDTLTTSKKGLDKKQQVDAAMENFTQKTVAEPVKKKYGWIGTIVLLAIIGLGIYFMVQLASSVGDKEIRSLDDILAHINVKYALISVSVLFGVILLESTKFFIVTHATTGLFRPLNSIKVALLGKYYDNITPFGSGGQPMQAAYLYKKGYSAGVSTAIVMIKYFTHMVCWLIICMLLMIINRGALAQYVDAGQQQFFMIAGWIGWGINVLLPVTIILFAIFPKITNKILGFFIGIITKVSLAIVTRNEVRTGKSSLQRKVKILRRKQKWIHSANKAAKDFQSSFIVMSHKPFQFILLILCCFVEQSFTWAFPYFILAAFANDASVISWEVMFAIMTLNVYATMAVSVVPTPGNSGVLENVVLLIFKTLAASVVFWVVFVWRFFTYYIYILIGLGITIFEVIRKVVRNKRQQKQQ